MSEMAPAPTPAMDTVSRVDYRRGESPAATADLPNRCAAAIITDPPYGTATASTIYGRRQTGRATGIRNDTDLSELETVAPEMVRLLSPSGVALVFCAPTKRRAVEGMLEGAGLNPLHSLQWDKGAPGISYRVRYSMEECILAVVGDYDPWDTRRPIVVPIRYPRLSRGRARTGG